MRRRVGMVLVVLGAVVLVLGIALTGVAPAALASGMDWSVLSILVGAVALIAGAVMAFYPGRREPRERGRRG